MYRFNAIRQERPAIAVTVVLVHLLLWLLILMSGKRMLPADTVPESVPIFARFFEQPRMEPLGSPAPVKLALVPVTQPKLPTPVVQLVEIETLDSPAPGPDPAPSSSQLVSRPGTANAGGRGYPASMGNEGLKLLVRVPPVYPGSSMQRGEEGVVRLTVNVDANGRVAEVRLFRSSGFTALDAAAIRAVRKWRFAPLLQDGRPVSAWTQINVGMSMYQHKYCRIRDNQPAGELVHDGDGSAWALSNEAVLGKLIEDLSADNPDTPGQIRAILRNWGPVQSVRHSGDLGYQGWVTREILPAYRAGQPDSTVQVRWDMYLVQHQRRSARWNVATDRGGEIWCVHVGPGAE